MKHAYKIWHSEAHKSPAKRLHGRVLEHEEISLQHQLLAASLQEHIDSNPVFDVHMRLLAPSTDGVVIVLESNLDSDAADAWIASCLVRLNDLDPNLCLIAEPLPRG